MNLLRHPWEMAILIYLFIYQLFWMAILMTILMAKLAKLIFKMATGQGPRGLAKLKNGSWKPTPKGISLGRELIPELKEEINRAVACVEHVDQGVNGDSKGKDSREGRAEGRADE